MTTASFAPDHAGADIRPSPNFGERRDGKPADILLLHYTGMETGQGAEDWLCDPQSEVSCHYIVHEDGRIVQMVPEENSRLACRAELLEGRDRHQFPLDRHRDRQWRSRVRPAGLSRMRQIEAVIELARGILARHAIAPERVLAHSDVAPGRKRDPGELFPWSRLAQQGIGHWVEPSPLGGGRFFARGDSGQPVEALQSMLALYGYRSVITGVFDENTAADVAAFQRHFRPARVDGVADISTIDTLHRLLSALPSYA
jgi:N-acetylmuramoyl-L-alanine amidase